MITGDIDILQQFGRLRINMSIPTGSESEPPLVKGEQGGSKNSVRKDFSPRSPSIKARFHEIGTLMHNILYGYEVRFSVNVTPLLPTLPDDQAGFISLLAIADRVVIQEFHASNEQSLVANTRSYAIALKKKYEWGYKNEHKNYQNFK